MSYGVTWVKYVTYVTEGATFNDKAERFMLGDVYVYKGSHNACKTLTKVMIGLTVIKMFGIYDSKG